LWFRERVILGIAIFSFSFLLVGVVDVIVDTATVARARHMVRRFMLIVGG